MRKQEDDSLIHFMIYLIITVAFNLCYAFQLFHTSHFIIAIWWTENEAVFWIKVDPFSCCISTEWQCFSVLAPQKCHNYFYQGPGRCPRGAKQHYLSTIMSLLVCLSLSLIFLSLSSAAAYEAKLCFQKYSVKHLRPKYTTAMKMKH